jgi:hypothetical protein
VKDRDHAGLGVEIFAIRADDVNGLNRRRLEQDVVAERLVLEWRRHGEIRDLQEFGVAIGEPFRSRQALALRTVPVAAGIIGDAGFAAVLALLCPPSAAVQRQTPSATQVCRARLAPKAKDLLQALLDALVDVAGVGVGLWFSYLFILFYLLIVVSPVKLPFLNMDLPHLMIVVSCR